VATAPQRLSELEKDRAILEQDLTSLEELKGDYANWRSLQENLLPRYRSEVEELRVQFNDTQHLLKEVRFLIHGRIKRRMILKWVRQSSNVPSH
jgi:hypothetical protein